MQFIRVFLDIAKFADFPRKIAGVSRTHGMCHMIHIFLDLFKGRYNCAKFQYCRICVTDFREGAILAPPSIREQPQKSPS